MDSFRLKRSEQVNPVALAWICDNKQQLHVSGWSAPELYRRNQSKGIAWLRVWSRKDLSVTLSRDGSIKFQYFNETGKPITQTAFPRRRAEEKQLSKLPIDPLMIPPEVSSMTPPEATIFHGLI